jgi:sugar/nucleoside kinase (ribokinase family)
MVRICALGAASQDVYLSGHQVTSSQDAFGRLVESFPLGAKIDIEKIVFSTGGGATNAAVTFARQNIEAGFIGKIGQDMAGDAVIAELDQDHVDASRVIYDPDLGTQYSTVLLANTGERSILIYRGAAHAHTAGDYEEVDLSAYDWLYVSSFAGAMEALDVIFSRAKQQGIKIAFNPGQGELDKVDQLKSLLEDVEILIVNRQEALQIVEGVNIEELVRHATNFAPVVVISDGPSGVIATEGETIVEAGVYEDVPVIDRTGAGDAFGSGFLSQWAQGKSLKESIIFASANSTSVVGKIGAKAGILSSNAVLHDMPITEKPF